MTSETQEKARVQNPEPTILRGILNRLLIFAVVVYLGYEFYEHHIRTDHASRPLQSLPFFSTLPQHFKYEELQVTTSDGYILKVFVVFNPLKVDPSLPPVLIQHGYACSGVNFVLNGDQSVAFLLGNLGYKTYIVNGRGTPLSLQHTNLKPDTPAFWEFSFPDLARDSVAVLDYIYSVEGKKAVYIGHSQGAAQFLAGASSPELAPKFERFVAKAFLLAPVWCMQEATSYPVVLARAFGQSLEHITRVIGHYHLGKLKYPEGVLADIKEWLLNFVCGLDHRGCFLAMLETDYSNEFNNMERYGTWIRYHLTSASVKGGLHFGQVSRDAQNGTCKPSGYDYGEETNLKVYFTKKPPTFDIASIRIPMRMYFGSEDKFYGPKDEANMRKTFEGRRDVRIEHYERWGHQSFVFGPTLEKFYQDMHKDITGPRD